MGQISAAIDRVAFTISLFGMQKDVYWYGIIIATGMVLAICVAFYLSKLKGYTPDDIIDMALIAIPMAVVGARVYYVTFMWKQLYANQPFWKVFAFWEGGMAIYGGVIFGLIGVLIYAKWKKKNFWDLCDICAPCLILGQAIGRWGNFINQEAFGYQVTNPALQFFPFSVYIQASGTYHLATFFYESMWDFMVFGFLMWYAHRKPQRGRTLLLYLGLYGLGRALVEPLRMDSLYIGSTNLRVSQWVGIALAAATLTYFLVQWYRKRKSEKETKPLSDELLPSNLKIVDDTEIEDTAESASVNPSEANDEDTCTPPESSPESGEEQEEDVAVSDECSPESEAEREEAPVSDACPSDDEDDKPKKDSAVSGESPLVSEAEQEEITASSDESQSTVDEPTDDSPMPAESQESSEQEDSDAKKPAKPSEMIINP